VEVSVSAVAVVAHKGQLVHGVDVVVIEAAAGVGWSRIGRLAHSTVLTGRKGACSDRCAAIGKHDSH